MALVSVITATYRRPVELARAIASVRAQTYPTVEHIVVSDGPGEWAKMVTLPTRFVSLGRNWRSFRGVESRGADPRMVGCMLAQGEYIAYLDDDNEWTPDHLECAVAELERTGADFLTTQAHVYPQDYLVGDGVLEMGHVDTSTLVHKTECLKYGNWVATATADDDWHLMRTWRDAGLKWAFLERETVIYHRQ